MSELDILYSGTYASPKTVLEDYSSIARKMTPDHPETKALNDEAEALDLERKGVFKGKNYQDWQQQQGKPLSQIETEQSVDERKLTANLYARFWEQNNQIINIPKSYLGATRFADPLPEGWSERVVDPRLLQETDPKLPTWAPYVQDMELLQRDNTINPALRPQDFMFPEDKSKDWRKASWLTTPEEEEEQEQAQTKQSSSSEGKGTGTKSKGLLFTEDEEGGVTFNPWEAVKRFMETGDNKSAMDIAITMAGGGTVFGGVKGALGSAGGKPPLTVIEGGISKQEKIADALNSLYAESLKKGAFTKEDAEKVAVLTKQLKEEATAYTKNTKDNPPQELPPEVYKATEDGKVLPKPDMETDIKALEAMRAKMEGIENKKLADSFELFKKQMIEAVDQEIRGEFKAVKGGKSTQDELKPLIKEAQDSYAKAAQRRGNPEPDELIALRGQYYQRLKDAQSWQKSVMDVAKFNRESGSPHLNDTDTFKSLIKGMEFHMDEAAKAKAKIQTMESGGPGKGSAGAAKTPKEDIHFNEVGYTSNAWKAFSEHPDFKKYVDKKYVIVDTGAEGTAALPIGSTDSVKNGVAKLKRQGRNTDQYKLMTPLELAHNQWERIKFLYKKQED